MIGGWDSGVSFTDMIESQKNFDKGRVLASQHKDSEDATVIMQGLNAIDRTPTHNRMTGSSGGHAGGEYQYKLFDLLQREFKHKGYSEEVGGFNKPDLSKNPEYLRALEIMNELRGNIKKFESNVNAKQGQAPYPHFLGQDTQDWVGLGLKRVLRWATDQGFDRVGWPTSPATLRIQANQATTVRGVKIETVPELFDEVGGPVVRLSFIKQLDAEDISKPLAFREGAESRFNVAKEPPQKVMYVDALSGREVSVTSSQLPEGGHIPSGGKITGNFLDETVSKQDAKRILESARKISENIMYTDVEPGKEFGKKISLDLKSTPFSQMTVGGGGRTGEVYKTLYDKILPNLAKKMAKKWKSKVGRTNINEANANVFRLSENIADLMRLPEADRKEKILKHLESNPLSPKGTTGNVLVNYLDLTPKAKKKIREGLSLLD